MLLLLGVLTSFYVILQPVNSYEIHSSRDLSEETSHEDITILTKAEVLPSSSSQINVEFQSYLIEVFETVEETRNAIFHESFRTLNKALRLIIQEIISPNAP